jgi:quercetin dioxygenase-like cupin family protein
MSHPIPISLQVVQTARLQAFRNPRNEITCRELGLNQASGGLFSAYRVKTEGDWPVSELARFSAAWFAFIYVLDGTIKLRRGDSALTLRAHDAFSQISLDGANLLEVSAKLEFLSIQAHESVKAQDLLKNRALETVSLDAPESHVVGTGPRDFFDYRDLGLLASTDRQLEVQVIRAQRARQGGTGWHSHTMAQLSYGLCGWASLGVEGVEGRIIQEPGDALSIPADCVHNADSFSADYWALQLQIPPDYQTKPAPPPVVFA